jgi:hypothetical protein
MFILHVNAECSCSMSMLHALTASLCCILMQNIYPICSCCMSMLIYMLHVYAACPCCMPMLHFHAACPLCMSIRFCMPLLHVHPCCMFIHAKWPSMLHVHTECPSAGHAACPHCMTMLLHASVSIPHLVVVQGLSEPQFCFNYIARFAKSGTRYEYVVAVCETRE